ncbi:hypothetical protein ACFL5Z_13195 [Planctomycetota bacterium]
MTPLDSILAARLLRSIITALAALTLLTFLMLSISLSRTRKRLSVMGDELSELKELCASLQQNNQTINTHMVRLDEAADKIAAIEPRLNNLEHQTSSFAEGAKKIASILKECDTQLGETGQMMGKEATAFNRAVQLIHNVEEKFQNLQAS